MNNTVFVCGYSERFIDEPVLVKVVNLNKKTTATEVLKRLLDEEPEVRLLRIQKPIRVGKRTVVRANYQKADMTSCLLTVEEVPLTELR